MVDYARATWQVRKERVRYGYRRIHILLRREGWRVNAKRIYRFYREFGPAVAQQRAGRGEEPTFRDRRNERRPHASLDGMTPDQAYFTPLPFRSAALTPANAPPIEAEILFINRDHLDPLGCAAAFQQR